ncbi:OVARIAN TUMOR DOMAIN-containing deubiquitinating enzyme 4-like isoform X2 [Actinidia eriantha]|uniref:OVARIAN TUMOR DOMAIN-containing deubiquitinating enzyme 4-like isoform X2 n=1 Tax=Actinidia eriantha TaxID=165200 RepID=UPI00258BF564|nr:OVARIAN TUMOR DOMAIN-containing deubiquitinating enzyme 4-like isoform X2 [Actinidia eriantha]
MVCSLFSAYMKNVICLRGCAQRQMINHISSIVPQSTSSPCCYYISTGYCKPKYNGKSVTKTNSCSSVIGFQESHGSCFGSFIIKQRSNWHSLIVKNVVNSRQAQKICFDFSSGCRNMNVKLLVPNQRIIPKIKFHAEAARSAEKNEDPSINLPHGKKVYIDYSIIGIPGDGRCLFRSVAHGAYLRSGKPAPNEGLQKELADDLRARVADEFVKRRKETEWFVEGDFDTYIAQMRKPHVWGGEPELFMASHVLQMPITVYMYDRDSGGLITIAEYGQEYGKENPIKVLYHGFGHYDALQIPGKKGAPSKL